MAKDSEVTKAWIKRSGFTTDVNSSLNSDIYEQVKLLKPYVYGDDHILLRKDDGCTTSRNPNEVYFELPKNYELQTEGLWKGYAVLVPPMEVNTNIHQVVMSREVYNELIARASWDIAPGKHITRHIRKFNQHLKEEHQVKLAEELAEFKALKAKVYQIVNEHAGKTVFLKVKEGYTPLVVLGVGKDKIRLKCRRSNGKVVDVHVNQITVANIRSLENAPCD